MEEVLREQKRDPRFVWDCIGPFNVGGRLTALAVWPGDPSRLYAGTSGGGVWHSAKGGDEWIALWNNQASLSVGALAIGGKPTRIYCGTGEANLSADNYPGVGLYVSENEGKDWALWASSTKDRLPRRISVIAIDPCDAEHLCLGGVTHHEQEFSAMFTSRDGGKTWAPDDFFAKSFSGHSYWCQSIVFHPEREGVIVATIQARGADNGIWRTKDGGRNWVHLAGQHWLPSGDAFGRTSLAIAPSQPDTIYAFAEDGKDGVLGVFRSDDCGDSWDSIGGRHFADEGQIAYNNCIAVHPKNPDFVICGGLDLHRTQDGGRTWERITEWDAPFDPSDPERGDPRYAHADHHALLMPEGDLVYDANDGGLDVSEDGGRHWKNRSSDLAITMFYDVDVAPTNESFYGGGTQDNGTVLTDQGDSYRFFQALGGDGGWMVYDPSNETRIIASYQNIHIWRHEPETRWVEVTPPGLLEEEYRKVFLAFIAIDPSNSRNKAVFFGSNRVWRSRDFGGLWEPVSPVLDDSPISAIEIADADPRCVYVGTTKGGIFRSIDGGNTWSQNLAGPNLPGKVVTRIETHPVSADTILATVGGRASEEHPHVFLSKDRGDHWQPANAGLPCVPHHAVTFETQKPYRAFVACDVGVFQSEDLGQPWTDISGNLPNAMVTDLVYHRDARTLTAATYGRSLWRLQLDGNVILPAPQTQAKKKPGTY